MLIDQIDRRADGETAVNLQFGSSVRCGDTAKDQEIIGAVAIEIGDEWLTDWLEISVSCGATR